MIQNLNYNKYYKLFSIISVVLVILSLISILFKGLNYGVDFKGGTLIELRINDNQTTISNLRSAFNNMNLGDVAIKNFKLVLPTDYKRALSNNDKVYKVNARKKG